jgi:hypothetical protein
MKIRLSDLPADLQRRVLEENGLKPSAARPPRARRPAQRSRLMQRCSCGFEIFRPDGVYPGTCDGCGSTLQLS